VACGAAGGVGGALRDLMLELGVGVFGLAIALVAGLVFAKRRRQRLAAVVTEDFTATAVIVAWMIVALVFLALIVYNNSG
jgi:hypothetical protein